MPFIKYTHGTVRQVNQDLHFLDIKNQAKVTIHFSLQKTEVLVSVEDTSENNIFKRMLRATRYFLGFGKQLPTQFSLTKDQVNSISKCLDCPE